MKKVSKKQVENIRTILPKATSKALKQSSKNVYATQTEEKLVLNPSKPAKEWCMIPDSEMDGFLNIVRILTRYYDAHPPKINETHEFRRNMLSVPHSEILVALKKFGDYEYMVCATVQGKHDSWIHVDGIAQERQVCRARDITTHPVFEINCLGDIWERSKDVAVPENLELFLLDKI